MSLFGENGYVPVNTAILSTLRDMYRDFPRLNGTSDLVIVMHHFNSGMSKQIKLFEDDNNETFRSASKFCDEKMLFIAKAITTRAAKRKVPSFTAIERLVLDRFRAEWNRRKAILFPGRQPDESDVVGTDEYSWYCYFTTEFLDGCYFIPSDGGDPVSTPTKVSPLPRGLSAGDTERAFYRFILKYIRTDIKPKMLFPPEDDDMVEYSESLSVHNQPKKVARRDERN